MEVLIDSKDSNLFDGETANFESPVDIDPHPMIVSSARQYNNKIDKLCDSCVESKSTQMVKQNKTIILTTEKLKEMHADLWGPHKPPSQFRSVYATIFIYKHTQKT